MRKFKYYARSRLHNLINKLIYLLGLGGGGGVSTVSTTASGSTTLVSFFFRSLALVLGTLTALGFLAFADCDFFDALEKGKKIIHKYKINICIIMVC